MKARDGSRGATITEFALIAPVFFLLLLGIIEGGRIFSSFLIITNEAREGARYGVVGVGDPNRQPTLVADVRTYTLGRLRGLIDTDPTRTAVNVQLTGSPPQLAVGITYRMDVLTPLIQNLVPNPMVLRAQSVMKAEQ